MKILLLRIENGFKKLCNPINLAVYILVNGLLFMIVLHTSILITTQTSKIYVLTYQFQKIAWIALWIVIDFIILLLYGIPIETYAIKKSFNAIGMDNSSGEIPELISIKKKDNLTEMVFNTASIPLVVWQDKTEAIEAALNRTVVSMKYYKRKELIMLTVTNAVELPEYIAWESKYMPKKEGILVLGKGYAGLVVNDLLKVPHILIGGATGSGKSQLVKLLIYQCLQMGAEVTLSDFKGGIDYGVYYHQKTRLITTEKELNNELNIIVDELHKRQKILQESGCENISEYNRQHSNNKIKRIVIVVDEIAEITDTTGQTKEQKQQTAEIVKNLSTIARLGRAFNINLIIATQRPDANVLPGQIKNNITCRICGRADNVLSQMILDNTDAADKISKDAQGRFLMQDETEFQAFLLEHKDKISLAMYGELASDYEKMRDSYRMSTHTHF